MRPPFGTVPQDVRLRSKVYLKNGGLKGSADISRKAQNITEVRMAAVSVTDILSVTLPEMGSQPMSDLYFQIDDGVIRYFEAGGCAELPRPLPILL
jgi:hypothetical protein